MLALLPYVYKRSVSSYPKQISCCSLSAQGSDQDLIVLLLWESVPIAAHDVSILLAYWLEIFFNVSAWLPS